MKEDHFRYDRRTQEALLGVVREVLAEVCENGLPGEHHFYITFDCKHEGVSLSEKMRQQYPDEMTIVLQNQFWDLTTSHLSFEVSLSFSGTPEKLVVPFAAIKRFLDPSVNFGLQFEEVDQVELSDGSPELAEAPTDAELDADIADEAREGGAEVAEVVKLDAFRKKN